MVTAASDKRMRRRGGRRRQAGSEPAAVGTTLREAREAAAGVDLVEIQDRTGVPLPHLEALEAGDLSRFPDRRSALTAVRRFGDLVQADVEGLSAMVESRWGTAAAGFAGGGSPSPAANGAPTPYLTQSVPTSHLSRYPGDGTHLRALHPDRRGARRPALRAPCRQRPQHQRVLHRHGVVPGRARALRARAVPVILRGAIWVRSCSWPWPSPAWASSTTTPSFGGHPPRAPPAHDHSHGTGLGVRPGEHPEHPGPLVGRVIGRRRGRKRHGLGAVLELQRGGRRVGTVLDRGAHPPELLGRLRGHASGGRGQGIHPSRRPTLTQHERLTGDGSGPDQRQDRAEVGVRNRPACPSPSTSTQPAANPRRRPKHTKTPRDPRAIPRSL